MTANAHSMSRWQLGPFKRKRAYVGAPGQEPPPKRGDEGHAGVAIERHSAELLGRLDVLTEQLEAAVEAKERELREEGSRDDDATR